MAICLGASPQKAAVERLQAMGGTSRCKQAPGVQIRTSLEKFTENCFL